MAVARRLYLYIVAGVALAVWAAGTERLLRLALLTVWDSVTAAAVTGSAEAIRRELSVGIALLVVGFPIWAIHWWLIQRGVGRDHEEARSAVRSAFLTLVLLVTFGRWVGAAVELLRQLFAAGLGVAESAGVVVPAVLEDVALFVVSAGLWLAHARLARAERWTVALRGAADWLPRLYGYGAALVGLSMLVWATTDLLRMFLDAVLPPTISLGTRRLPLARDLALLVVGLAVWWLHWGESLRLVAGTGAVAERERRSLVRWSYLGFVVFSSLAGLLVTVALIVNVALRWLLGLPDGSLVEWLRLLLEPLPWAMVAAIVWWYHRTTMRREAEVLAGKPVSGPDWAAGVTRFLLYLSAFASLGVTVLGLGGLLGTFIDAAVGLLAGVPIGAYRDDLAIQLAMTLVGAGTWLASWRAVLLRTAGSPEEERRSVSRRVYLFATLGLSVLVLLGTLGFVAYQAILVIVGLVTFTTALAESSGPLGFALVAGLAFAYHVVVLTRDSRAAVLQPASVTVHLVLRLPPESDPETVVRDLAGHLPPGAALERVT